MIRLADIILNIDQTLGKHLDQKFKKMVPAKFVPKHYVTEYDIFNHFNYELSFLGSQKKYNQ